MPEMVSFDRLHRARQKSTMLIDASAITKANARFVRESQWAQQNIHAASSAIDVLRAAACLPLEELDDITLLRLGIRLINSAGASGGATLDGYYQPGASHIRDIIELGFLLDLFRREPSAISRWRDADDRNRWKTFRPGEIRNKLDKLDGVGTSYRADAFKFFSDHGTHPNPAAIMLISPGMNTIVGPFPDQRRVIGLSYDLARHLWSYGGNWVMTV